jgi:hypothetical protein
LFPAEELNNTVSKSSLPSRAASGQQPASSGAELNITTQLRFPDSPEDEISIVIRRMNAGFVKLFSKRKVPVAAKVEIQLRGDVIHGEVLYCRPERDGYSIGMNLSGLRTVRRELRLPVDFPALLRMPGSDSPIKIRIVDMSSSGLGLALPMEIEAGTGVAIEFSRGTVFGEIRHCVAASGYFRAGVAAEEFIARDNPPSSQPHGGLDSAKFGKTA